MNQTIQRLAAECRSLADEAEETACCTGPTPDDAAIAKVVVYLIAARRRLQAAVRCADAAMRNEGARS